MIHVIRVPEITIIIRNLDERRMEVLHVVVVIFVSTIGLDRIYESKNFLINNIFNIKDKVSKTIQSLIKIAVSVFIFLHITVWS